jgi:hypothetical protein
MPPPGHGPHGNWRKKAVGVFLLIAFLPLLVGVLTQAVNEMARAVVASTGWLIPYAVVVLVLAGIYKLALGRRRM